MKELWSIYHSDIPPFLQALSQTPPMQRLRDVGMNCGCEYTRFPRFQNLRPYSRFSHSMGVGLIVWHFTASAAQAIAGALHDIATPVFAHTVDFLLGDHMWQESTEARTAELIEASPEIQAILTELGLSTAEVADYHRYPIADNDTPRLAADRLEYTLGNLLNYGFCSLEQLKRLYDDLCIGTNEDGFPELSFRTTEKSITFTGSALQASRIYIADEDRFSMEMLAALLRSALERSVLLPGDLYATESVVIKKLLADKACAALWQRFRSYCVIRRMNERPERGDWVRVPAKLRYIDPLVLERGRVSCLDAGSAAMLESFRQTRFDYWVGTE